ncbi:MAG: biotin/lipoyl-containing protein [Acidimicrobiales bacterium]
MRIVRSADDLAEAVEAASREALSAFGDGTVFIEPYIENGRHVEVQIMGDSHGNVVHLGERECSIQRRNQKVLEESPSAGISEATRQAICDGALAFARHIGYENAGTVEFLVADDPDGTPLINFLEVNTRLQVEHPVTEAVTGLDLVELQLRVAAGEPLPITQDDVTITGHAIEVRLVAEDPAAGWLPSTGVITAFDLDPEGHLRVDTGFRAGAEVTPDYDSLLAKVIGYGPTRSDAARTLACGLRLSQVTGIATNLVSSVAMLGEADFLAAKTTTSYLDQHPAVVEASGPDGEDRLALLLGAVFAADSFARTTDTVTPFAPSGWRNLRTQGERSTWVAESRPGEPQQVEVVICGRNDARVLVGPWPEPGPDGVLSDDDRRVVTVRMFDRSSGHQILEIDGRRQAIATSVVPGANPVAGYDVATTSRAGSLRWSSAPRFVDHEGAAAGGGGPICPLPGTVIAVHVEPGQRVTDGTLLMVVEAMKMEHKIIATSDAVVGEVRFAVGDRVDQGDLLVQLDASDNGEDSP